MLRASSKLFPVSSNRCPYPQASNTRGGEREGNTVEHHVYGDVSKGWPQREESVQEDRHVASRYGEGKRADRGAEHKYVFHSLVVNIDL